MAGVHSKLWSVAAQSEAPDEGPYGPELSRMARSHGTCSTVRINNVERSDHGFIPTLMFIASHDKLLAAGHNQGQSHQGVAMAMYYYCISSSQL